MAPSGDSFRELAFVIGPPMDSDNSRGRTRDRSMTRSKTLRTEESSTLRGRSRRRSISPFSRASRASSPNLKSPNNRLLLRSRLHDRRREHCPSRNTSPAEKQSFPRGERVKNRSGGPQTKPELHRSVESYSRLRNEIFLSDEESNPKAS